MMVRAVIRKSETPWFVLNSQVRVADWEQVCGTHQGQRQYENAAIKGRTQDCADTAISDAANVRISSAFFLVVLHF
jgi:hypothetical protein